jgi:G3E family GTPase
MQAMSELTQVYLITGFLGAGKTTFLNRIIKSFPKHKKLTLLVNEFGEIGIDGTLVEGEDIDIMEINKGSIFCVCVKTDFIKGLYELNTTVRPDVLLIESTGVANPSDLKKDLKLPIFNNRFRFIEQFCIIDAPHFLDAFEIYTSLEKQIASSSVFIINKVDKASSEIIKKTKEVIHRFHPDPLFFETMYAEIPLEKFFDFASNSEDTSISDGLDGEFSEVMSPTELDQFLEDLLDSPDLEITPPDLLVSVAYQWTGDDVGQIKAMADRLPPNIVRAKGFVEDSGRIMIFNYVLGDWTIETPTIQQDKIKHKNIIVFIGSPESMPGIEAALQQRCWINLGIHQAYSQ